MFFGRREKKGPRASRSKSREKPSPVRDLSPTMLRRHSIGRSRDEESCTHVYETPPRTRKPPRITPRNSDHSRLNLALRRSLLKFRSSPSRSRWIAAVCVVFFLGVFLGAMEPDSQLPTLNIPSYDASTAAKPAEFTPTKTVPDPVEQDRPEHAAAVPVSELKQKPVMVEVPSVGEDGSNLGFVRTLNLRAEGMPEIDDDTSFDRKYSRPYKDRSYAKEGCELLGDWQESQHPSCSKFHEIDMHQFMVEPHILVSNKEQTRLVNNGAYRDVWMFRDFDGTRQALKTLRYNKRREFDLRNYERHRRDAVALEQISGSPYVADIYGFCGMSALADFSSGGDLYAYIDSDPSNLERLRVAHVVAASIADAHHVDSQGRATIAHTDIKPNQWIIVDGGYKLNDFNRARLLTWDPESNEHCGFTVQKNAGMWRSPEEYNYKPETEKIDVYSMGNVLYYIMTGAMPFEEGRAKMANELVMRGKRPRINEEIRNSDDPYYRRMVEAMEMCWEQDPKRRTDARAVAELLETAIKEVSEGVYEEEEEEGEEAEPEDDEDGSQDDEGGSDDDEEEV